VGYHAASAAAVAAAAIRKSLNGIATRMSGGGGPAKAAAISQTGGVEASPAKGKPTSGSGEVAVVQVGAPWHAGGPTVRAMHHGRN
jgi:hypothetical protein